MVRAQGHPEHIGDDFLAHALPFELSRQILEYLACDVRERRSDPSMGRELGDEDHGLLDDGVDEELWTLHGFPSPGSTLVRRRV